MLQTHNEAARIALEALSAITAKGSISPDQSGTIYKSIVTLDRELHDAHTTVARTLAMEAGLKEWQLPQAYNVARLTATECSILTALVIANHRPVSRKAIYDSVYVTGNGPELKIIDVMITKIRQKLAAHQQQIEAVGASASIETKWGFGYRLMCLGEKLPDTIRRDGRRMHW